MSEKEVKVDEGFRRQIVMQLEIGLLKKLIEKKTFSLIRGVATQNLSNFSPE